MELNEHQLARAAEVAFTDGLSLDVPGAEAGCVRARLRPDGQWVLTRSGQVWDGGWTEDVSRAAGYSREEAFALAGTLAHAIGPAASIAGSPAATIFDLAAAVLERTGEIPTMKLHKLAYYCQGWHLAWDEELLSSAVFTAHPCGPVDPDLYDWHRGIFLIRTVPGRPEVFTPDQIESIDQVIAAYQPYRTFDLSAIVKSEQPWADAYKTRIEGAPSPVISTDLIRAHFQSLDRAEALAA